MRIPSVLHTIGYQGRTSKDLIEIFYCNEIEEVIDVRELPLSRLKGFSKTELAQALEEAGIRYESLRSLGSPRELRREYRQSGDFDSFASQYRILLQDRQSEICDLMEKAYIRNICLLCFERNSDECHRKLVAEAIREAASNGLIVSHL